MAAVYKGPPDAWLDRYVVPRVDPPLPLPAAASGLSQPVGPYGGDGGALVPSSPSAPNPPPSPPYGAAPPMAPTMAPLPPFTIQLPPHAAETLPPPTPAAVPHGRATAHVADGTVVDDDPAALSFDEDEDEDEADPNDPAAALLPAPLPALSPELGDGKPAGWQTLRVASQFVDGEHMAREDEDSD